MSGALIRSIDWAATPVGPIATWPRSLLTTVEIILHSRHPMFLWWGTELTQFYNDAYLPSFGVGKHPAAMGQPGRDCWDEIWPIIGPQIDGVMTHGTPTWHEDALVPIHRNERIEEVYWTYGYSPVFDDDRRIGGTLVICTESTGRVLAERRERLIQSITDHAVTAESLASVLERATADAHDVPFAIAFPGDRTPALSFPRDLDEHDQLARIAAGLHHATQLDLAAPIQAGPWPEPVTRVFAAPLRNGSVVVFGLSARLPFDETYRDFLLRIVDRIAITHERVEAAALRRAADRQRADLYRHFMQAPFLIAVFRGPTHVVELANPPILAAWGKGAEVIGQPLAAGVPELLGQPFLGWLDDVFRTGVAFEGRDQIALLPTGPNHAIEEVYTNFVYAPLRDASGATEGILVSAFIVTEQVRARQVLERTLARAESSEAQASLATHRLRAAQRAAQVGVFDWDVVAAQMSWSPEIFALMGVLPGAITPSLDACHHALFEDDRERFERASCDALVARAPVMELEVRLRCATGGTRWVRLSTELQYDDTGDITRAFGAVVDIQTLKEAAEQRATALAEAERTNRAKDEFLATMSHELRTPLNAILGWATMLRSMPASAEKLARGLEVIERNAEAQARLISDLLDVSRIISGKLRLSVKRVDVTTAIQAALDVVHQAADAKGVQLAAELDPDTGVLVADPDRLQQIVWNLLSNAVKFTPAGGRVRVTVQRIASRVRICVIDTGAGIASEHLPVIFDRFRQIDGSITRSHGGLGLGLAIVRHLVEAHGGTVAAHSDGEGTGTTFTVEMPVHAIHTSETQQLHGACGPAVRVTAAVPGGRLDGSRVLAVDDEEDSLELLRVVLETAGATVVGASSARAAFEALTRDEFDLVISDVGMPETDGYGFMRQLRMQEAGGDIPAIALTAYARAEDTARAFRAGYQEHVTKPVDAGVLLATVERMIRR